MVSYHFVLIVDMLKADETGSDTDLSDFDKSQIFMVGWLVQSISRGRWVAPGQPVLSVIFLFVQLVLLAIPSFPLCFIRVSILLSLPGCSPGPLCHWMGRAYDCECASLFLMGSRPVSTVIHSNLLLVQFFPIIVLYSCISVLVVFLLLFLAILTCI